MTTLTTNHSDATATPDLQTIMNDVAALKHDLARLVSNMKTEVTEDVTACARTTAAHLGDEASRVYGNLAAQGQRSAKAIGHQIEEQPVISLLVAFAIGFLGSRLLSR